MRYWLLFTILLLPISVIAQEDYHPLVTEGKTWEYSYVGWNPEQQDDCILMLRGDTIINGASYKKLYQVNGLGTSGQTNEYFRAMRETDRKVYCIPHNSQEEHLLFDFNLQAGDSVFCEGDIQYYSGFITETAFDESQVETVRYMKLIGTDTYTSDEGVALRRYYFSMKVKSKFTDGSVSIYEYSSPVTWIEGIGPKNDNTFNSWCEKDGSSFSWMLTRCYDSDHFLYEVDSNDMASGMLNPDNSWSYWFRIFDSQYNVCFGEEIDEFHFMGKEKIGEIEYSILEQEISMIDANEGHWFTICHQPSMNYVSTDAHRVFHLRESDGKILMPKDEYTDYVSSAYNVVPDIESLMYREDEIVLYDFTLSVGDRYPMPGDVTITKIDSVDTGHGRAREYILSNSLRIVEGVGCVNSLGGLIAYQVVGETEKWAAGTLFLYSVMVNDGMTNFFYFVNNEMIDQLTGIYTQTVEHPKPDGIYDLTGKQIQGNPSKGIYIQNGKKYVVK